VILLFVFALLSNWALSWKQKRKCDSSKASIWFRKVSKGFLLSRCHFWNQSCY